MHLINESSLFKVVQVKQRGNTGKRSIGEIGRQHGITAAQFKYPVDLGKGQRLTKQGA